MHPRPTAESLAAAIRDELEAAAGQTQDPQARMRLLVAASLVTTLPARAVTDEQTGSRLEQDVADAERLLCRPVEAPTPQVAPENLEGRRRRLDRQLTEALDDIVDRGGRDHDELRALLERRVGSELRDLGGGLRLR